MATNYQRGRQFEYRTRDKLLKKGAVYVMRAASSKGAADLIAIWPGIETRLVHDLSPGPTHQAPVWLVQCKRDGKLPRAEREELLALSTMTGTVPVLAKTGPNGRGVKFINLKTQEELLG